MRTAARSGRSRLRAESDGTIQARGCVDVRAACGWLGKPVDARQRARPSSVRCGRPTSPVFNFDTRLQRATPFTSDVRRSNPRLMSSRLRADPKYGATQRPQAISSEGHGGAEIPQRGCRHSRGVDTRSRDGGAGVGDSSGIEFVYIVRDVDHRDPRESIGGRRRRNALENMARGPGRGFTAAPRRRERGGATEYRGTAHQYRRASRRRSVWRRPLDVRARDRDMTVRARGYTVGATTDVEVERNDVGTKKKSCASHSSGAELGGTPPARQENVNQAVKSTAVETLTRSARENQERTRTMRGHREGITSAGGRAARGRGGRVHGCARAAAR